MQIKTIKEKYLPPVVEVIEVENEGVMALSDFSGGNPGLPGGNPTSSHSAKSYVPATSSFSDLEDFVNDILTIEN
ncbi:hypothetical protein D0T87_17705 [Bacteroides sp. 51]|nr:hypothetical protein [Bacteroides sp. 51]NDV83804.1 hypothetical protein [Bacteroides sp. 51]